MENCFQRFSFNCVYNLIYLFENHQQQQKLVDNKKKYCKIKLTYFFLILATKFVNVDITRR